MLLGPATSFLHYYIEGLGIWVCTGLNLVGFGMGCNVHGLITIPTRWFGRDWVGYGKGQLIDNERGFIYMACNCSMVA